MFKLQKSEINGKGVFAIENIPEGIVIGVWVSKTYEIGGRYLYNEGMECRWYETPILGRYCNHSLNPNTTLQINENELILLSKGILTEEEITTNYKWVEDTIGFIVDLTNFNIN